MSGARVASIGVALPERRLTNADLVARLGVSDSWIVDRSGIHERRIAGPGEDAATLGTLAARRALAAAGVDHEDVDLIVCATVTASRRFPAVACLIGADLGTDAAAYDLNAGCAGFLFALAQADAAVRAGSASRALVVGTDVMTRITDQDDARSSILFGDGAGAVLLEPSPRLSVGPFVLASDGARPDVLTVDERDLVVMHGREVYRRAVAAMASSLVSVLALHGRRIEEIDQVIAHQANQRILDAVAERVGLPRDRVFSNIALRGNTSAASIPLALFEADQEGALSEGDSVALTAFGAGFCWGSGLLDWSGVRTWAPDMAEAAHV